MNVAAPISRARGSNLLLIAVVAALAIGAGLILHLPGGVLAITAGLVQICDQV
jgi:hypothetical protein